MKKRKKLFDTKSRDSMVVLIYLSAGLFSLNFLGMSAPAHILGIAFIIAASYGIVMISKGKNMFS